MGSQGCPSLLQVSFIFWPMLTCTACAQYCKPNETDMQVPCESLYGHVLQSSVTQCDIAVKSDSLPDHLRCDLDAARPRIFLKQQSMTGKSIPARFFQIFSSRGLSFTSSGFKQHVLGPVNCDRGAVAHFGLFQLTRFTLCWDTWWR